MTATAFTPAVPAGVVQVIEVLLTTVIPVAEFPPKVTLVAPLKLFPVMVTGVPPDVGPLFGEQLDTVGAAT